MTCYILFCLFGLARPSPVCPGLNSGQNQTFFTVALRQRDFNLVELILVALRRVRFTVALQLRVARALQVV